MRHPKAVALDSVMKNPELSKTINDAINSEPGSTARKKARSLLRAALAASNNRYKPSIYDGQGGTVSSKTDFIPAPQIGSTDPSKLTIGQNYSGVVVLKDPTKFNKNDIFSSTSKTTPSTSMVSVRGNTAPVAASDPTFSTLNLGTNFPQMSAVDFNKLVESSDFRTQKQKEKEKAAKEKEKVRSSTVTVGAYSSPKFSWEQPSTATGPVKPAEKFSNVADATKKESEKAAAAWTPAASSGVKLSVGVSGKEATAPTGYVGATGETGATGVVDNATGSTGPVGSQYDFVNQMYQSGIGKEAFASMVMQDRNKLAEILGVPVETLPKSLLLGDQYQDIESSLRQEYNLDNLASEILTRQRNAKNIDKVLEDYMTERDSYINNINETMDKAKEYFRGVDMGNPYNQQDKTNYLNFLTTLKGRQQKRYADFLKMSTDMYGQETQALIDNYTIQKEKFDSALKNKQVSTQEEYNNMKSILQGLYDAQDNLIDRESKLAALNKKLTSANGEIAGDTFDAAGNLISAGAYELKDTADWDKIRQVFNNTPINLTNNRKLILTSEPIADIMNKVSVSAATEGGRLYTPTFVISSLNGELQNNINDGVDITPGTNTRENKIIIDNYQNLIAQYYNNNWEDTTNKGKVNAGVLANAQELAYNLATSLGNKVKENLAADPANVTAIQNAINDYVYQNRTFRSDKPRTWSEVLSDTFLKDWKARHGDVNDFVLDAINKFYQAKTAIKKSDGTPAIDQPVDVFLAVNNPENDEIMYIDSSKLTPNQIANFIVQGALSTINYQGILDNYAQDLVSSN